MYRVLEALRKHNLKLEPEKCHILKEEIQYLGHMVDQDGIRPMGNNAKAIINMKHPATVRNRCAHFWDQ